MSGSPSFKTTEEIQNWIRAEVAVHLNVHSEAVNPQESLLSYGLGSMQIAILSGSLEQWLNCGDIPAHLLFQDQSLVGLSEAIHEFAKQGK